MTNLQYIKKPSKRRQAEDAILAGNAFKDNKCGEYDPKINPYKDGIRHDRFKRYYEVIHRKHVEYEPIFRDLCEVYGFDPEQHYSTQEKQKKEEIKDIILSYCEVTFSIDDLNEMVEKIIAVKGT